MAGLVAFLKGLAVGLVLVAVMFWATETTVSVDKIRPSTSTTHHPEDGNHTVRTEGGLTIETWNTPPESTTTVEPVVEHPTTSTVVEPDPPVVEPPVIQSEPEVSDASDTVDFWYDLATCESENGRTSENQFQFMGGTAEKVGYYSGASYSEQRAMAQGWAESLRSEGTHPGSSAGWPECWAIAGGV